MLGRYKDLNAEQIDFIIKNHNTMHYKEIAKVLDLSVAKVVAQTQKLQKQGVLGKKPLRRTWTQEQENLLLQMTQENVPMSEITKTLQKPSVAILAKIKQMRKHGLIKNYTATCLDKYEFEGVFSSELKKWTKKEKTILLNNCKTKTAKFLATLTNHSMYDVICELRKLDTNIINHNTLRTLQAFSYQEDLYIVQNIENATRLEIEKRLPNHPWKCILHRGRMFGKFRTECNDKVPYDELVVEQYLKELKIPYQRQKRIYYNAKNFYIIDFLINNNVVIEVQGKYWHCHPKYVPHPNKKQQERISHDIEKRDNLQKMGYVVVWLWEHEILQDEQACKQKILSFAS